MYYFQNVLLFSIHWHGVSRHQISWIFLPTSWTFLAICHLESLRWNLLFLEWRRRYSTLFWRILQRDLLNLLKNQLDIKVGLVGKYIGLQVMVTEKWITITQDTYITKVIERFNLSDAKKLSIPVDQALYSQLSEITTDEETNFPYREAITQSCFEGFYREIPYLEHTSITIWCYDLKVTRLLFLEEVAIVNS